MKKSARASILAAALAAALAGCSSDGSGLFSTGSLNSTAAVAPEPAKKAPEPKFSQACVSMATQIENLRKEGTVDRLEKAAAGKSENVQVKRASLSKQTELNKANADFVAKCGPALPRTAVAPPVPATPVAAAAETAKKKVASVVKTVAAKPATPPQAKDAADAAVAKPQ